jgi:hypothetical protein
MKTFLEWWGTVRTGWRKLPMGYLLDSFIRWEAGNGCGLHPLWKSPRGARADRRSLHSSAGLLPGREKKPRTWWRQVKHLHNRPLFLQLDLLFDRLGNLEAVNPDLMRIKLLTPVRPRGFQLGATLRCPTQSIQTSAVADTFNHGRRSLQDTRRGSECVSTFGRLRVEDVAAVLAVSHDQSGD